MDLMTLAFEDLDRGAAAYHADPCEENRAAFEAATWAALAALHRAHPEATSAVDNYQPTWVFFRSWTQPSDCEWIEPRPSSEWPRSAGSYADTRPTARTSGRRSSLRRTSYRTWWRRLTRR